MLWACQESQSVSHFKLNSIRKSTGLSGIEVCQDHRPLLQISVNNPVPMPKLTLLSSVNGCRACQPGWQHEDLCLVPILSHRLLPQILGHIKSEAKPKWTDKSIGNVNSSILSYDGRQVNHRDSFYKNGAKEVKTRQACHFSGLFSLEHEKTTVHKCVFMCVCSLMCVHVGRAVGFVVVVSGPTVCQCCVFPPFFI